MSMTVTAPSENATAPTGGSVLCTATATFPQNPAQIIWTYRINGGQETQFGQGPRAVFACPASIQNTNGSGSDGVDSALLKAFDPATGVNDTTTLLLVQGVPRLNQTYPGRPLTAEVGTPGTTPQDNPKDGGLRETVQPGNGWSTDEENYAGDPWEGDVCVPFKPDFDTVLGQPEEPKCGCSAPLSFNTPDGRDTVQIPSGGSGYNLSVATPGGGAMGGIAFSGAMFCPSTLVATASQAWVRAYGSLQLRRGCGVLWTRGQPIELCTWFLNRADGLASAERIAGKRTSFGWQARLIQDTTGNVAIYWGDRTVEAWKTTDGGSTFVPPKGTFGTLTKQGDGSFTRTTKDLRYFDFNSAGRLQTIKDRTVNGNIVYYNYNGSNQPIRIVGPGLGYKPYFLYDGNGRVSAMNLEGASPWPERTTYYDYDGSGRMNKVIWPENCVSYLDYDGNDNLKEETNPDNYRAYFNYGSQSVPRLREINLPESAALYLTYNDSVPRQTRSQADGTVKSLDYMWAGLAEIEAMGTEVAYFEYEDNAKPVMAAGTDGYRTYWAWDSTGQVTAMRSCDGALEYFTYGPAGRVTSWKDSAGETTYWNHDARGFQTNRVDAKGNTTYFERDDFGRITSKKDRLGNLTYYTWNSQGLVTSAKAADGTVRYFDYNPAAEVETAIDELGNVAYYHHDGRGRLVKWKDFAGQAADYGFDNRSNLTVMVDRRGNAWYFEYDGLSRRRVSRTALLNTAYFNYSRANVLTSQVDPRGNPTYFYYTAEKRLLATENALKELTYFMYTSSGQTESVKDARGYAQYLTYDCRHRQTSVKDGVGNVVYYRYDAEGDQAAVTDSRGNTTYLYYDELDRMTARRNPLNELDYFYYDAEGNRTCSEDALQRRTYFYFDRMLRRFAAEDSQKNLTYYTFEQRGPVSSAKNARGFVNYLYYDRLERQFCGRDALGNLSYMEYDANSNRVASKDPRGNTSYFEFDADNRNFSSKTPLGETTYFAYDAAANRTNVKDALGRLSYFYFDSLNRNFCSEDAKQARNYFTFDATGNTNSQKDPLARVTYHDYDGANRRVSTTDAAGGMRTFVFDPAGNNNAITNERAFTTYFDFDALNRMISQLSPVGGATYYAFDSVGQRTSVKDPAGRLNYFYFDTLNRQQAVEDGLQQRTYFEYDPVGNTVSIKNPRRATVSPAEVGIQYFTYDALSRRNSAKDEVAQVWYYDYDAASNLQVQRNPRAAFTYWEYDALNRKQSQKDPLARTWYWTYDAVGNVSSVKDGKAQVTYYQYGSTSLLDRTDYPDSAKHYFEYDAARQRTAMADPTGRTEWLYDSLGRATYRLNPWFGSSSILVTVQRLYYQYDAAGNRTSLKDQDAKLVYYDWDGANRMSEVRSADYGGWLAYYEYNPADQMVHQKNQNGTITYHGYDAAGRVSRIYHRKSDGSHLDYLDFTRDEVGNPILVDVLPYNLVGGHQFIYFNYDPANRITREMWKDAGGTDIYGFDYAYDEAGNRKNKQHFAPGSGTQYWEYDVADQLQVQRNGGTTTVYFEFDQNANLAVEHDVDGSAGRTYYDYEPRNLLSRVDFPGRIATNYFYYNGVGERVRKDDSTGGKLYTWDGIGVVVEKDRATSTSLNRLVKGFTPVAGIGPYVMLDAGALGLRKYFYHKNQVGSTLLLTDTLGVVTNAYRYDAWGQPFEATEVLGNQYRFNGKELDTDFVAFNSNNRRYHYPWRTYIAFRAAFLQLDVAIRIASARLQALNRSQFDSYITVNSAPTVRTDPTGLVSLNECDRHVAFLLFAKNLGTWRLGTSELIDAVSKNAKGACAPPIVSCECCGEPGVLGSTSPSLSRLRGPGEPPTARIKICWTKDRENLDIAETLDHELVHWADLCAGANMNNCHQRACTEIRAYTCTAVGFELGDARERAIGSTEADPSCKPAEDIVDAVWDMCKCPKAGVLPGWPFGNTGWPEIDTRPPPIDIPYRTPD